MIEFVSEITSLSSFLQDISLGLITIAIMNFDLFHDLENNNGAANFRESNGLNLLVPSHDESFPSTLPCVSPLPTLPLVHESELPQNVQSQEGVAFRPIPSPAQQFVGPSVESVVGNDILRFLNLVPPQESDSETISKISAASSSCGELPVPVYALNPYLERRPAGLPDVYSRPGDSIGHIRQNKKQKRKETEVQGPNLKRRKATQPSKFCHICVKSMEQVPMVPCANVINATCRKATCQKCFIKHGYIHEWEKAYENVTILAQFHAGELRRLPEEAWTCLHCRSMCPASAQCKIYSKTNRKRHLMLKQKKIEKERHLMRNEIMQKTAQPVHHDLQEYINTTSAIQTFELPPTMPFQVVSSPPTRAMLPSIREIEGIGLEFDLPKHEGV